MVINEYNILRLGILGYLGDYSDGVEILMWFKKEWKLSFTIKDSTVPSPRKRVTVFGENWNEELSFESITMEELYTKVIMTYLNSYFRCINGEIIGPKLSFGPEIDTEWT